MNFMEGTKKMNEIKIGQTVYLVPLKNNALRGDENDIYSSVITKIGTKYVHVDGDNVLGSGGKDLRFNRNDLSYEDRDWTSSYALYFDEQEIHDERESKGLNHKFRDFFTYERRKLSVDQLRRIDEIINENNMEGK